MGFLDRRLAETERNLATRGYDVIVDNTHTLHQLKKRITGHIPNAEVRLYDTETGRPSYAPTHGEAILSTNAVVILAPMTFDDAIAAWQRGKPPTTSTLPPT